MSDLHKAAQQALDRLRLYYYGSGFAEDADCITALEAALAQQAEPKGGGRLPPPLQAEPVAWRYQDARGNYRYRGYVAGFDVEYAILKPVPLFTAPPQRPAEPVQEPVAWMCSSPELMAKGYKRFSSRCEGDWNIPVYTAPPQRKPLTDEEIDVATAQERDALLDHIYEYGTAAEGVLERIRKLCRAAAEIGRRMK